MWQNKNTVLIYISDGFQYKPSIAGFGLMRTLIKIDTSKEWCLGDPAYLEKLKVIHESGGSIVFFSNHYGLHVNTIKARFGRFMTNLGHNIPVMALFATRKNCFMKPFINLWKVLGFMYQIKQHDIPDIDSSIYVGKCDGGLYLKNWKEVAENKFAKKIFRSSSDVDRAFAHNVGIQFVARSTFFHEKPESKWKWYPMLMDPEVRLKYIKQHKNTPEPSISEIIGSKKYLVIVMGMPSSGRSTLIKRIVSELGDRPADIAEPLSDAVGAPSGEPPNVVHVKQQKYTKKLIKTIKDFIWANTTIIKLDFSDYTHRTPIIKIAREYDTPILIVYLTTERKICEILNFVKVQTSTDFSLEIYGPDIYADWQKKFEALEYDPINDKDITVVEYPMVLRYRKEIKYRYSPS